MNSVILRCFAGVDLQNTTPQLKQLFFIKHPTFTPYLIMFLSLLVFYSLASYLFSGSVCYLALKADQQKSQRQMTRSSRLMASAFWPMWLMHNIREQSVRP